MPTPTVNLSWDDIIERARAAIKDRGLGDEYVARLEFELSEIDKQGAGAYYLNFVSDGKRFDTNPNHLLLPWLLGLLVGDADRDPLQYRPDVPLGTVRAAKVEEYKNIHDAIPSDFIKDPDMPDIDLDCLPDARDPIKEYAMRKYGTNADDEWGPVCSVGTWQTYKFKSAIIDACHATGQVEKSDAYDLTGSLPDDVDDLKEGGVASCKGRVVDTETGQEVECGHKHAMIKCPKCGSSDTDGPTLQKLLKENEPLMEFARAHKDIIAYAVRLIGKIKNMGMHAGALIIADRPLYGNIPMAKSSNKGYWVSMWSEGRNTQLSKFGYLKWDLLGLKTLEYIFNCCKLIEDNRGISFGKPRDMGEDVAGNELPQTMSGWDDIDPTQDRAGHFFDKDGNKHYISLNDEHALELANLQKTDAVFQFDTDLAKSILANGVRNFEDLMLFNAMGHPGPMASIPEAVENRDDVSGDWKEKLHPKILPILEDTYGVIVFQEDLQAIWQVMAGFTAPEAQEARKAVAKKWAHKLKPIREKWLIGASRVMPENEAKDWWTKMETFGRYAFNKCLHFETKIKDQLTGEIKTIEEWYKSDKLPFITSYDEGECVDECVDIHYSGELEVLEIEFDNGQIERVTEDHKFLCVDGEYHEVREIIDKGLEITEIDVGRNSVEAEESTTSEPEVL